MTTDYRYDLPAIRDQKSLVHAQSTAIGTAASGMSSLGAGGKQMYGILVGQIAHPILSQVAKGGEDVVRNLADLLDSIVDGLNNTVAAYEQTERDHQDLTQQIVKDLDEVK